MVEIVRKVVCVTDEDFIGVTEADVMGGNVVADEGQDMGFDADGGLDIFSGKLMDGRWMGVDGVAGRDEEAGVLMVEVKSIANIPINRGTNDSGGTL